MKKIMCGCGRPASESVSFQTFFMNAKFKKSGSYNEVLDVPMCSFCVNSLFGKILESRDKALLLNLEPPHQNDGKNQISEVKTMQHPEIEKKVSYSEMVQALAKPGDQILVSLSAEKCHLLHMAVGVTGEAGELIDAVKKHVVYGKELDRANIIEELGDLEFYAEGIRQAIGVTREEVLLANMNKLSKRYANKVYSDVAAQARADKAESAPAGSESEPQQQV